MIYNQLEETIENSHIIGLSNINIEAQILDCLLECFNELESLVQKSRTVRDWILTFLLLLGGTEANCLRLHH
jgi:hypothetical protein